MKYQSDIITVAVVNFKVETGDKEKNVSRILDFSKSAAKRTRIMARAQCLCFIGFSFCGSISGRNSARGLKN